MKAKHFEGKLPKTVKGRGENGKCPYCKKKVSNIKSHVRIKHLVKLKQEKEKSNKKHVKP